MNGQTIRVLSIDGGGMRGLFSSAYLEGIVKLANNKYGVDINDFGKQFDLIVGTSTGAIIGSGLAAGIPLEIISSLYADHGEEIFPKQLPKSKFKLLFHRRKEINKKGEAVLKKILTETFGSLTLGEVYQERRIGLVIPAVNCTTHKAWVFKTPHDSTSSGRDDDYTLVDACLASSAAPIYRSLAAIKQPGSSTTTDMFVDGGLWANNPVLIALIEALRSSDAETSIEIYSLGTTPPPTGSVLDSTDPHWGLGDWEFGAKAIDLALDSQTWVYDQMVKMLIPHLDCPVKIIRFPQPNPSAEQSKLLNLDNASSKTVDLLKQLAVTSIDETNQIINSDDEAGKLIKSILCEQLNRAAA